MDKYDAVVIGGGPSGSAAAYTLAKKGKKVLIIDKDKFPRQKLCGGMMTEKDIKLLKKIFDHISFKKIIDSTFSTYEIYHKKFGLLNSYTSAKDKIYLVNRKIFDNYLFQKAIKLGCAFKQKNITDLKQIKAPLIIGADGANSVVRRAFKEKINNKNYALALEIEADKKDVIAIKYPRIYFGYINYGYAWVFPRHDKMIIGIGAITSKNKENIRTTFVKFLKDVLTVDYKKYQIYGHPLPTQNYIKDPIKDNLRLVGDAAGFIEPLTGEGIYFALNSGYLAAQNTYKYRPIQKLLRQAEFMKNIFYHPLIHRFAMTCLKKNPAHCKSFFDLISGKIDYFGYIKSILNF